MFRRALTLFGQGGGFSGRLPRPTRTRGSRARSSGTNNSGPSSARTGSLLGGLLEAGLASGGLSLLGDLLAQHLTSPAGLKVRTGRDPRGRQVMHWHAFPVQDSGASSSPRPPPPPSPPHPGLRLSCTPSTGLDPFASRPLASSCTARTSTGGTGPWPSPSPHAACRTSSPKWPPTS